MAKIYVNTVKYQIVTDFEIEGIVDKHDIIGAIFGQSEGLLGEELDLRELQKSGKIGRLEVEAKQVNGKTIGKIFVPSSMDMVQTSLLAAAIEAVDKVGPCDSRFKTEKIADMRESKRKNITERAREILKDMVEKMPETQELAEGIRFDLRSAELVEIGPDKLPAGPEAETAEEIIIVEGRADVLNLLKYGIKNVLGIDGSKIPASLPELCRGKNVTLFIDGDRGGEIILRNLSAIIKIDNIARAPDGKEVEELTQKEALGALRKKTEPRFGYARKMEMRERNPIRKSFGGKMGSRVPYGRPRDRERGRIGQGYRRMEEETQFFEEEKPFREEKARSIPHTVSPEEIGPFGGTMREIENSLKARLLDESNNTIKEISVRELLREMTETPHVHAVVFDGIVTKRLVDAAAKNGIKIIVGVKKGKIEPVEGIKVITLN